MSVARAQEAWPDRPIRLVVPFAPGGVTDSIGRLSAEWLSNRLGKPVVVENRSGGNGSIATEFVAASRPDGYTLLVASASQFAVLPALTPVRYDPVQSFAPISIVASNPFALAVPAKLGVSNLQEFVALAKRDDTLNYASAGNGSGSHLTMALFLRRAGIEMQHVPYRGGGPATQDLLAGRVAAYFGNPAEVVPQAQGGTVRIIATSGSTRVPELPDVPTVAEQGVAGLVTETWNGLAAPAGTPPAVVARIAEAMRPACQDAAFRASLARLGVDPVCNGPAEMGARVAADLPVWKEAVQISGATLD
ncbi:Bug family tripartite tricarboxylate transporter substrate binding protein [Roseomonas populi]|uniref:Tripartite tricarboxylate transporter substrate binding protein n=1 Tax=Roseomonas populi TaxID=3121582 RepID=A0ABT1X6N3_9PROT|nr:tripartite tricarboxylate transporter substrate binding protein [Roseomonas pecuniae]MCR0983765.1 tripartite tricarboxylate transporter substrate binding protein [Roseomonas pecuniae]